MNPLKKLAGQTLVYGMGTIVPRLLNYLLTPFFTRILLKAEYGVLTDLYAYTAILLVLLTYGMETAFFRYAGKNKNNKNVFSTVLTSVISTAVVFIGIMLFFLTDISNAIGYVNNSEFVLYVTLIVAMDAVASIPFAFLRQKNRAFRFSTIKLVNVGVNIFFNVFFLWGCPEIAKIAPDSPLLMFYNPDISVGYIFISNLISSAVTMVMLFPEIFKIRFFIDKQLMKKLLQYAFPILVVSLAGMVNEVSDKILLKYLLPDNVNALEQLGVYGANYKLAVLMTIFIQMFRYAAEPFFFSNAGQKNSKVIYAAVMKFFVIFGLTIFLGVTLFLDIFKYFIDETYYDGLNIVAIVLLANLLQGIFYNLSVWYKINDLTKYGAYIAITGSVITLFINFLLVPKIGYIGSALGHLSCYTVMVLFSFFLGRKYYKIEYPLMSIASYFVLALAIYFITEMIHVDGYWTGLAINAVFFLVFVSVAFFRERDHLHDF
ncbi:MAG: oligosaccharide flippase family protein [Bacteroidota bacterium]|nr:oligosaccharide flippase family protein [Bacteroidota bacterium]